MKKISIVSAVAFFLAVAGPASAHVVVRPAELGVGERTNFVVSVPTEKEVATTAIRLVIPDGIKSVRPNVKPGWTIRVETKGDGMKGRVLNTGETLSEEEAAEPAQIIWSGGSIPAGQRDEFVFSSQAPAEEVTLAWKAYQTYADGEVVAWDADAKQVEEYVKNNPNPGEDDHNAPKPYSETKVVNDLTVAKNTDQGNSGNVTGTNNAMLSIIAIVLSAAALGMQLWKR